MGEVGEGGVRCQGSQPPRRPGPEAADGVHFSSEFRKMEEINGVAGGGGADGVSIWPTTLTLVVLVKVALAGRSVGRREFMRREQSFQD